jgi:hypothetical protein
MRYFREVSLISFGLFPITFLKVQGQRKAILSHQTYLLFPKRKGNLVPLS